MEHLIELTDVSKSYGEVLALSHMNLAFDQPGIYGFIGPDGAGKTTLFRLIASLLVPDSGNVTVLGYDTIHEYKNIRVQLGYMPGRFSLYPDLTVEENLNFYATIFHTSIQENYHLIKDVYVQLEPFKKRLSKNLSGGMKQKLALCCALIHSPKILILDEPTTGVDAVSRKEFWHVLNAIKKEGILVLVSTPYMDEAELCDKVALMQKGHVLYFDFPENIIRNYRGQLYASHTKETYWQLKDLQQFSSIADVYLFGQDIHISCKQTKGIEKEISSFLAARGHEDIHLKQISPNIEDCFIQASRQEVNYE